MAQRTKSGAYRGGCLSLAVAGIDQEQALRMLGGDLPTEGMVVRSFAAIVVAPVQNGSSADGPGGRDHARR